MLRLRHRRLFVVVLLLLPSVLAAEEIPKKYVKYFRLRTDSRSLLEKALNFVDTSLDEVPRGFALIAGIDTYPNLRGYNRELKPAKIDVDNLEYYLREFEFFDEIVVLRNEAVTYENLAFFLENYFPRRLQGMPRNRFLFAYSGHGVQDGELGFLLRHDAERFEPDSGISLSVVRGLYGRILRYAHQSLILINACHAGAFLGRESFGRVVPQDPGHWAITAGGSAKELVWHDQNVGPGSVFFEKLFAGLSGRADTLPFRQKDGRSGDGLITVEEIFTYLKVEIQYATAGAQTPKMGNISIHGDNGSFFFLNRQRQLRAKTIKDFDIDRPGVRPMGPRASATFDVNQTMSDAWAAYSARSYQSAFRLYEIACNHGHMEGCAALGHMYQAGLGGQTKDERRASELYRQACRGSSGTGCLNLGIMYKNGAGGLVQSDFTALEFYRIACEMGSEKACKLFTSIDFAKVLRELLKLFKQKNNLKQDLILTDGQRAALEMLMKRLGYYWAEVYLGLTYEGIGLVPADTENSRRRVFSLLDAAAQVWSGRNLRGGLSGKAPKEALKSFAETLKSTVKSSPIGDAAVASIRKKVLRDPNLYFPQQPEGLIALPSLY